MSPDWQIGCGTCARLGSRRWSFCECRAPGTETNRRRPPTTSAEAPRRLTTSCYHHKLRRHNRCIVNIIRFCQQWTRKMPAKSCDQTFLNIVAYCRSIFKTLSQAQFCDNIIITLKYANEKNSKIYRCLA